jgi:methionine biosynthesis protein MetW
MRADLQLIQDWIAPGSRVLDLGCGDGSLLAHLQRTRQVKGCGIEIDADKIQLCLEAGVNVLEQDMEKGLGNFEDASFDTVILAQTLQALHQPREIVREMLRVGRDCILTFPNFAYWRHRLYLLGKGRMPKSTTLPYEWYNTPNLHHCTINDFDRLCARENIKVLHRTVVDDHNRSTLGMRLKPNLCGINAIYHITR